MKVHNIAWGKLPHAYNLLYMKKIFFTILFIVIGQTAFSQLDIIASFNSVDIGRNVSLTLKKDLKKHSFLFGVKYHINKIVHDNQNNVFRKRFYAKDWKEHFGFNIGYQYNFDLNTLCIKPFLFYDFQFTNSHTRNLMYLPYDYDLNGDVLYKEYLEFFGPFIALENNIGLGFTANLGKNLFLYQKAGVGIVTFYGNDPKRPFINGSWEFGYMISFGLGYRLYNVEKSP